MHGEICLITGKKGSGKSLWVVDQLFKEFDKNPDRNYYADITGLKHTGIKLAPEDWREVPDNSLVVFDEVQFKDLFSRHNSKRDKQILELTTMRKRGIELWIITQRARFLNADVLGLVDRHVEIQRKNDRASYVYIFTDAEMNITKTKKLFAHDKYIFVFPEHLFGFYESIKEGAKHGKKSWINKGVLTTSITLLLCVIFGGKFIYSSWHNGGLTVRSTNDKELKHAVPVAPPVAKINPQNSTGENVQTANSMNALSQICRSAENLNKPECIKWYNDLSNNNMSVSKDGLVSQNISYNPDKPFSQENVPKNLEYQVMNKPIFSGCMKTKSGTYKAFTEQGTYLKVSASDCRKLMNDAAARPYDYFNSHNKSNSLMTNDLKQSQDQSSSMNNTSSQNTSRVLSIDDNSTFKGSDITKPSV
ncbi:zonular occludens toxin domain-containing protein [Acinetobacter sp. MD2(2019)]|uniref:zonular occludens toxin domain-containing protein n=1 Tax=Acinetobacter sp. MD2(2019) TaxID=2605273 RepID=UPI002D1EE4E5|nr:zonular occludens toxin domain-containing protein [Acinetobacter sp. MD2(2019)]MEB3755192.1 hypothetical protein [Acinetobacter sp. MD2(2019)]